MGEVSLLEWYFPGVSKVDVKEVRWGKLHLGGGEGG